MKSLDPLTIKIESVEMNGMLVEIGFSFGKINGKVFVDPDSENIRKAIYKAIEKRIHLIETVNELKELIGEEIELWR